MEVRTAVTFLRVAELQSFSRAAQQLGYSQAAVTVQIKQLEQELGWKPVHSFASGLRETVHWYLEHGEWVEHVRSGTYRDWIARNYRDRG